jgi:hypothetical protein
MGTISESVIDPSTLGLGDPAREQDCGEQDLVNEVVGLLLIHSSKTRSSYDREALVDWENVYGVKLPPWEEMVVGALVGVVELVDCAPALEAAPSPWVEGPACWVLANPRAFLKVCLIGERKGCSR